MQLYRLKASIFTGLMIFLQGLFGTDRPVQAIKIVNDFGTRINCKYVAPNDSITYIHHVSKKCPKAYITSWNQGTYGNTKRAQMLNRTRPLPIWMRITFDRKVTQNFIDKFFSTLKSINKMFRGIHPVKHGKFTNQFVIRVGPYYKPAEIKILIEKANIAICKKMLDEASNSVKNYT